ncbi:MAG: beta-lactamase family protein [Acidimicrobiia bacterium]|nr:beta-lactamase family protein [Acidimicrobiia bacterium]
MTEGYVHPDFGSVAAVFDRVLASARRGGGAVCVYHRGERVADMWGGDRNPEGDPWDADTIVCSFSTTKGVASTALHVLADRGLVDYDAAVACYWPEFAANGKERITVRQVMSHEAGLHGIRGLVDHSSRMLDWEHMVAALAAAEPAFEPGSANAYHGITYGWLAGEIVRRVSGKSIGAFVQAEIADPLGAGGLFIGVPDSERGRAARLMRWPRLLAWGGTAAAGLWFPPTRDVIDALLPVDLHPAIWAEEALAAEIPGAAGAFDARSLARMYAALSCGGSIDGAYLVSPGTVAAMGAVQNRRRDRVLQVPIVWRLGYHTIFTTAGVARHAFGHYGYLGSGAWCDPSRELAVAYVTNRTTTLDYTPLLRLGGAAVRAADRRR